MALSGVLRLLKGQKGATAAEYVILAGLVAIAIVVGAAAIGTNVNAHLSNVAALINSGS